MQSASAALTAAIEGAARRPVQRVAVDWDSDGVFDDGLDDLTAGVESITVDRSVRSDLPTAARLLTGYGSAEASVQIGQGDSDDPTRHAAWWFSAYNHDSPLASKIHLATPFDVQLGMDLPAEPEVVSAFRGRLRDITVHAGSRSATLTALDNAEQLRKVVSLPSFPADDLNPPSSTLTGNGIRKPGLTGQWVIDYVLRQCGIYASPPPRSGCALSATMHGSVWPEVGTLNRAIGNGGLWPMLPGDFIPTDSASAWMQPESSPELLYQLAAPVSTNDLALIFVEMWADPGLSEKLWDLRTPTNAESDPTVICQVTEGALSLFIRRNHIDWPVVPGPTMTGRTYVGVHITFTDADVTVRWRVDGVTTTQTVASIPISGAPSLTRMGVGSAGLFYDPRPTFEAVQVANEAYSDSMWSDDFVPTAVLDVSLNALVGIPAVENAEAWQLVQDVTEAEFGLSLFDETGRFRFRNRHWRTNDPHSAVSQRTLTATTAITDIGSVESVDTVRNHILIHAQPVSVTRPGRVWAANETLDVPADTTVTVWADLQQHAAYQIDRTISFSPLGGQSGSGYRATTLPDGSGDHVLNLSFQVEPLGTRVRIAITNPNPFRAHLVHPAGFPNAGGPALSLWGQVMTSDPPADQQQLGAFTTAWRTGSALHVPAGQTLQVWAPVGTDAYADIDTAWAFSPSGGQIGSGYRASQNLDGSGGEVSNLSLTGTSYATQTRIDISNSNDFDVYLVNPTGYPSPGAPALSLWARTSTTIPAVTTSGASTVADAADASSIRLFGEQLLELPAGLWRQSSTSMQALAEDLLFELSRPRPVLTNLSIVADPRLQLCDRVTLVDADGLALEGEFFLGGIHTVFDAGGMSQQITARAVKAWGRPTARYDVSAYGDDSFYG